MLGCRQVLQAVRPEIVQLGIDEVSRRLREQHLAAMPGGRDTGSTMHIDTHIALVRDQRLARMQPHPHPHRSAHQRRLGLLGRRNGIRRPPERDKERITLRIHLHAAVMRERPTQDAPVLRECIGIPIAELGQQTRRALDVREQERYGPGWQLHVLMIAHEQPGVSQRSAILTETARVAQTIRDG